MRIRTNNQKGWMDGGDADGIVLNFVGRSRGTVRYGQAPTIQCDGGGSSGVIMNEKIRKLTERECLRLMGYDDPEIDRLVNATDGRDKPMFSRTSLYQFAGNSVVVDCFTAILDTIINDMDKPIKTLEDWF